MENKLSLETQRLLLRPLGTGDIESTLRYANDPDATRYMLRLPMERAQTEAWLAQVSAEWRKPRPDYCEFAVVLKGEHIGAVSVYVDEERDEGELGWILAREHWGQGYATEAARALVAYSFEVLALRRLIAHCDERNTASRAVMEKLGMRLEVINHGCRTDKLTGADVGECIYRLNNINK